MHQGDLEILTQPHIRQWIASHIDRDPASLALSVKGNEIPSSIVFTQLKYLQRCRSKLPSYFQALCIIPPRAYEQSSSEAIAALKNYKGEHCLDLTAGLGVDSQHFAKNFTKVTSLEKDENMARATAYNFELLGLKNVEIITRSAEEYLKSYQGLPFDLIYVDPDRRDKEGRRQYLLEACQPNVLEIMPLLMQHGRRIVIKASPLFDIREAWRLIPEAHTLSIHSLQNEVKEVLIVIENDKVESPREIRIRALRSGRDFDYFFPASNSLSSLFINSVDEASFILEPDAAFYKARLPDRLFQQEFPQIKGKLNHSEGFFFAQNQPEQAFPGRIFKILDRFPFKPKLLKRQFGKQPINVIKRHFPMTVKEIRQKLQLREGGDQFLICSLIRDQKLLFLAEIVKSSK